MNLINLEIKRKMKYGKSLKELARIYYELDEYENYYNYNDSKVENFNDLSTHIKQIIQADTYLQCVNTALRYTIECMSIAHNGLFLE